MVYAKQIKLNILERENNFSISYREYFRLFFSHHQATMSLHKTNLQGISATKI